MSPTNEDRIDIRRQQIKEYQDMIAWERAHNWGNATEFRDLSDSIIADYGRIIATLEITIARLRARMVPATHPTPERVMGHSAGSPGKPPQDKWLQR
jgi:hypothetical protein